MFFHRHEYDTFIGASHCTLSQTNMSNGVSTKGSLITIVSSSCYCGKFRQQQLDGHVNIDKIKASFFHIL